MFHHLIIATKRARKKKEATSILELELQLQWQQLTSRGCCDAARCKVTPLLVTMRTLVHDSAERRVKETGLATVGEVDGEGMQAEGQPKENI